MKDNDYSYKLIDQSGCVHKVNNYQEAEIKVSTTTATFKTSVLFVCYFGVSHIPNPVLENSSVTKCKKTVTRLSFHHTIHQEPDPEIEMSAWHTTLGVFHITLKEEVLQVYLLHISPYFLSNSILTKTVSEGKSL